MTADEFKDLLWKIRDAYNEHDLARDAELVFFGDHGYESEYWTEEQEEEYKRIVDDIFETKRAVDELFNEHLKGGER